MDPAELKLDGTAVGGLLRTIFAHEMTVAVTVCNECGAADLVATLMVYNQAPGAVMRCPACDSILMRIVYGSGRYWLDLRGVRSLQIEVGS
jgi:hypothetical protein